MSWAAHELESYVVRRHLKAEVAFSGLLLGSLAPDLFTKLPVYGISIGSHTYLKVKDAAAWHRGWPGAGFTNSLAFGLVIAFVALIVTRHRAWALGLLIGQWAHALTDSLDTVGSMLLFPFSTQRYAVGMSTYSAQTGRYTDTAAYYSGLGGVWDLVWLALGLASFEVLRQRYFDAQVEPADPLWGWLRRRFHLKDTTIVAMYRAWFVYGACRIVAWTLWARLLNPDRGTNTVDLTWGGPHWVTGADPPVIGAVGAYLLRTTLALAALAATTALLWRLVGRSAWTRATADHPAPKASTGGTAAEMAQPGLA